jgi:hypothetical protein
MEPIVKNFDRPDDRPELPKARAELLHLGDQIVVRGVLEPGWRWSNDWQPLMGTPSCPMPHTGMVLSGQWHFEMDDGTGLDLGPGDVYSIPAGHDAWVLGDEPVRTIDWAPAHDESTQDVLDAATS